jgi:predicted PurR-regulated permease PerM
MAEDGIAVEVDQPIGSIGPIDSSSADGMERRPRRALWIPGRFPRPAPDRRSWPAVGFGLGMGLLLAYAAGQALVQSAQVLTLVLLSLFIAVSLDPLVVALMRRLRLRRGAAAAVVLLGFAALFAAFIALAIPPMATEISALAKQVPVWLQQLHDHHSRLGQLEDRYHLIEKAKAGLVSGAGGSKVASGVLGAGRMVIGAVSGLLIVTTLTIYFLLGMPSVKRFGLRFTAIEDRLRVEELMEKILAQVGRYMLGNLATSLLAGLATFAWAWGFGIPYAAMLGFFVAIMDLIPVIGSTLGGIMVSLVALAVSVPVAAGTAVFYTAFRFAEDHLITPLTMKYTVRVHPIATMIAVLLGGTLLGIIGALLAVPIATAIGLILDEVVFPTRDGTAAR